MENNMTTPFERFKERREQQIQKLEGNRDLLITGLKGKSADDEKEKRMLITDIEETIGKLQVQDPEKIQHNKEAREEIIDSLVEIFFHYQNIQRAIERGPSNEWSCRFTGINCYRSKKTKIIEGDLREAQRKAYKILSAYVDRPWAYLVSMSNEDDPLVLEEMRFYIKKEDM